MDGPGSHRTEKPADRACVIARPDSLARVARLAQAARHRRAAMLALPAGRVPGSSTSRRSELGARRDR